MISPFMINQHRSGTDTASLVGPEGGECADRSHVGRAGEIPLAFLPYGSISIETSLATMDQHARARQMIEMVGRYEQCRLAKPFPENVRAQLREPGRDFKLFRDGSGWKIYRAAYEESRFVKSLDGVQNVWTIRNDQPTPCPLGVEIVRGARNVSLHPAPLLVHPALQVNGQTLRLPLRLDSMQALTSEGPGGIRFWPGGMQPSQPVSGSTGVLMLQPGENRITFSADTTAGYPGDVHVLLYRMWPLR